MTRSRHIPIAVRRAVRARANNRCEVDGCEREDGLQYHHLTEFADGGEHTEDNLLLVCPEHHAPHTRNFAHVRKVRRSMSVRKWGCYRTSTDEPERKRKKIPTRVNPWGKGRKLRSRPWRRK